MSENDPAQAAELLRAKAKASSRSMAKISLAGGALGFLAGALFIGTAISRSRISTAAISYLFLPFEALIFWAAPAAVASLCAAYIVTKIRARELRFRPRLILAAVVLALCCRYAGEGMYQALIISSEVDRVSRMDANALHSVLASRWFGNNKFVLAAVAENANADADLLRQIASKSDPELQQKLFSAFDVMGKNTHGLAVLRLVADHPNTAPDTLALLANSSDEYVLGEVAHNPKTPEETLRKLILRGGMPIELSLAANPRAPLDLLIALAKSHDSYTRAHVAEHADLPPAVLEELSHDPDWNVRGNVALNRAASPEQLAALSIDPDSRVRSYAKRRLR